HVYQFCMPAADRRSGRAVGDVAQDDFWSLKGRSFSCAIANPPILASRAGFSPRNICFGKKADPSAALSRWAPFARLRDDKLEGPYGAAKAAPLQAKARVCSELQMQPHAGHGERPARAIVTGIVDV